MSEWKWINPVRYRTAARRNRHRECGSRKRLEAARCQAVADLDPAPAGEPPHLAAAQARLRNSDKQAR